MRVKERPSINRLCKRFWNPKRHSAYLFNQTVRRFFNVNVIFRTRVEPAADVIVLAKLGQQILIGTDALSLHITLCEKEIRLEL